MANNCFYSMRLVSKDKDVLKRVYDILNYTDDEYFIYRVFNADINAQKVDEAIEKIGDFFSLDVFGDVAWGISQWFGSYEHKDNKLVKGYEKDENGNQNYEKPIYGTAHYISLDFLCKKLGFGVEVWGQEGGMGFETYAICNRNGEISTETKDWSVRYEDDEGKELDPPEEEGGFEEYGEFSFVNEIYGD